MSDCRMFLRCIFVFIFIHFQFKFYYCLYIYYFMPCSKCQFWSMYILTDFRVLCGNILSCQTLNKQTNKQTKLQPVIFGELKINKKVLKNMCSKTLRQKLQIAGLNRNYKPFSCLYMKGLFTNILLSCLLYCISQLYLFSYITYFPIFAN